jgi:hypothetical protein
MVCYFRCTCTATIVWPTRYISCIVVVQSGARAKQAASAYMVGTYIGKKPTSAPCTAYTYVYMYMMPSVALLGRPLPPLAPPNLYEGQSLGRYAQKYKDYVPEEKKEELPSGLPSAALWTDWPFSWFVSNLALWRPILSSTGHICTRQLLEGLDGVIRGADDHRQVLFWGIQPNQWSLLVKLCKPWNHQGRKFR